MPYQNPCDSLRVNVSVLIFSSLYLKFAIIFPLYFVLSGSEYCMLVCGPVKTLKALGALRKLIQDPYAVTQLGI